MTVPKHVQQARARKREELLRLGLVPVMEPRKQVLRFPHLSIEQWHESLRRAGEDPYFEEVWHNA
jgi:hypothetical protein